jgi:phage-related protein
MLQYKITQWKIVYYSEKLEEDIFQLTDSLLARFIRMTEIMQEFGPNIGMPHTRALGDGLFELRLKGKEGIARIFYCILVDKCVCLLHSFIKKTQRIPLKELQLAKLRMKEVKNATKNT